MNLKCKVIFFIILQALVAAATVTADVWCDTRLSTASLPKSAVLIALGHDSETNSLQTFAEQVEKQIGRRVVTYQQFNNARYTLHIGKWWLELPPTQVTAIVEKAIRQAVGQYPYQKILAFNLNGYDPKELFDHNNEEVWSYTNFEVDLLLRNQKLFSATRWYKNLRELTLLEAEAFWKSTISILHKKKPLEYFPERKQLQQ